MKIFQSSNIRGAFNRLLRREELVWLLIPGKHMALLSLRRAAIIISRVRMISVLLAALAALVAAAGLLLFPWPGAWHMAVASMLACAAFIALAFLFQGLSRMHDAYMALGILYAIPAVYYAFALLAQPGTGEPGSAIIQWCAFIPLLMVAAAGMFPLTAAEAALYAWSMLALQVVVGLMRMDNLHPVLPAASAWLLIPIALIATISAMGQLGSLITLMRTAVRDALTGCFSRTSGIELLDLQFIISSRSGAPLSVANFDLDNIMGVREAFGQDAADRVVVGAANSIRALLRTGDMLARWGGENFVLIMPNTNRVQAIAAIERILSSGLGVRPDKKAVTASIGVAERIDDDADDWKALVETAASRLREARQSGNNRADFSGGIFHPAT